MAKPKHVTYQHADTKESVTYAGPVHGMERSKKWARVSGPGYSSMLKEELVELATQRGLDPDGTVAELRQRLQEADDAALHQGS